MTNKQNVLAYFRDMGMQSAILVREQVINGELTVAEIFEDEGYIPDWKEGKFTLGQPTLHGGQIWSCSQAHDSTGNPSWYPGNVAALFFLYHGVSKETARPFVQPTAAHDRYMVGEFMIWTDGLIYECLQSTAYDPANQSQAWRVAP